MKYGKWALVAAGLWAVLTGCHVASTFDGSVVSNDEGVWMDYAILDRRKITTIFLEEGNSLRVFIAQEAGTVDVTVGIEGQAPVYEGKGLADFDFTLGISESGTYQISVTGHGGRGSVAFIRVTEQSRTAEKCAARAPDWEGAWAARLWERRGSVGPACRGTSLLCARADAGRLWHSALSGTAAGTLLPAVPVGKSVISHLPYLMASGSHSRKLVSSWDMAHWGL